MTVAVTGLGMVTALGATDSALADDGVTGTMANNGAVTLSAGSS